MVSSPTLYKKKDIADLIQYNRFAFCNKGSAGWYV